ncbi:DUF2487 domain-containing protein [Filibacter tadaridae]|uniref:DUF2487 domain-containing protein n=1 Tax=Filibacter tadaridae TaxID=2483811 RepID=A0A3P5X3V0_9BACL|nr:DUF2487 family protein [Filibacter tadaridae]VDC29199.1 hypothetical protein FILTAD_02012 [Filibacter tadaridae]
MNWTTKDMDTYLQQKEYIDTLIVPLLKVETKPELLKNSSSSSEFLMYLTTFLETQFKGRMMLMPPFIYTQSTNLSTFSETLTVDLADMPFKHIFFITTDAQWLSVEIKGQVIWLPSIPLESMDEKLRQTIIEDQLRQVLPRFTEVWST